MAQATGRLIQLTALRQRAAHCLERWVADLGVAASVLTAH
jgi:hypothetical protein